MSKTPIFDIYVINLDKDESRIAEMKTKLSPNSFTRIPGIYGKEFDIKNCEDVTWIGKCFTPKAAIGGSLSHRKAMNEFYEHSEKEYALILEDDATAVHPDKYMEEVESSIRNAPEDWDMIRLDYVPWSHFDDYNRYPSVMLTAYIIRKNSVMKFNSYKISYYLDFECNFYGFNIYNNPSRIFIQIWDENNHSNNKDEKSSNPLYLLTDKIGFNCKLIRLFDSELSLNDILLCFIILFLLCLFYRFFGKKMVKITGDKNGFKNLNRKNTRIGRV